METSGASGASANIGTDYEAQANAWANQNVDGANGNWRTDNVQSSDDIQLTAEQYDAVVQDLVTKIGVEMVKQQNPTDKDKFSIDDDE